MKPALHALAVVALAFVSAAGSTAQSPSATRQPPASLTGILSLDPAGEAVLAARAGLEVPIGRVARPWLAGGAWALAGVSHVTISGPGIPPRPPDPSGALLELGVDAVPLPASWVVLPFAGVGAGLRTNHGERMLWPLVRAGADLQPWKWLAPRAQLEWTRYPEQTSVLLLSAGLRIGLPLHSRP